MRPSESIKSLELYIWEVVLPALAPVVHKVCEPLLPLIHLLLAKGLNKY